MRKVKETIEERRESVNKVEQIVGRLTEDLKTMIDTKMVVGEAIETRSATIIPISKVSVGFIAGGGEYDKTDADEKNIPFAGGSGAGYSVTPVGFIVVRATDVKLIKVSPNEIASKILEMVPDVVEAINNQIKK